MNTRHSNNPDSLKLNGPIAIAGDKGTNFSKLLQTYNTLPTLRYKLNDKKKKKKLVFLKQLSTFVEDRNLWVEPNRKYDFRLSPNPPFTIFVEYRLRFGRVKLEIKFPIDFALTFHYICCL